jgi:hypothetical protein
MFLASTAFAQDLIELQVVAGSDTVRIYFGTHADGTDGLAVGLDAILPPSPPGFTGIRPYFLIEDATFPKVFNSSLISNIKHQIFTLTLWLCCKTLGRGRQEC